MITKRSWIERSSPVRGGRVPAGKRETFKAHELAEMTEQRARQIIQTAGAIEGWRERPDWSGLVEQQVIFQMGRKA